MTLYDIKEYVKSLNLADFVYMGKMDSKREESIGVYHSKHQRAYKTAIGGDSLKTYGEMPVTFLVHWNKSMRESEAAAQEIFETIVHTEDVDTEGRMIKFIQPVYEPQDVGCDDAGICEFVIETIVIYEKGAE